MQHIVLIATAWGSRCGGINAFNYDLACALGILLKNECLDFQVVCLVAEAGPADEQDAAKNAVQLISLELPRSQNALGEDHTERAVARLKLRIPGFTPAHMVGHDAISGALTLELTKSIGGCPSLIHHMDYRAYEGYKHSRGQVAEDKHVLQQKLFRAATHRLAVGPLLRDSLAELLDEAPNQVPMLVPGFLDYPPRKHAPSRFAAIIFGRLETRDDRVKQGRLAVAALGRPSFICPTPIGVNDLDAPIELWLRLLPMEASGPPPACGPQLGEQRVRLRAACPPSAIAYRA